MINITESDSRELWPDEPDAFAWDIQRDAFVHGYNMAITRISTREMIDELKRRFEFQHRDREVGTIYGLDDDQLLSLTDILDVAIGYMGVDFDGRNVNV